MRIPKIPLTKRNVMIYGAVVSQFSYWTGVVVAKKLTKKKLQKEFDERLEVEVEKVKQFYKIRSAQAQYETPQKRVEELRIFHEAEVAMREYKPEVAVPAEPVVTEAEMSDEERRNIFEENQELDEEPDAYAREVESRDYEAPYIISEIDFRTNELEHEQTMLTYYADRVLADENDEVVLLVSATVGLENLDRFGHFSDNLEIVYVRNEKLQTDFEIHRDQTEYRVTVGGQDPSPVRQLRTVQRPPVVSARERFERSRGMARGSTG